MADSKNIITIPALANGKPGVVMIPDSGRVFFCIGTTASASFRFIPDNQQSIDMSPGRKYGNPGGKRFHKLTLYNDSAVAIDVIYYVGDEDYAGDPSIITTQVATSVKDASTYSKGSAITTINASVTTAAFNGSDAGQQRKQISISNGDQTVAAGGTGMVIQVLDNVGALFALVQPGQTWTHVSNGIFKFKNPGGSNCPVAIGETFYA